MEEGAFVSHFMALGDQVRRRIGHQFGRVDIFPEVRTMSRTGLFRKCEFQGIDCGGEK